MSIAAKRISVVREGQRESKLNSLLANPSNIIGRKFIDYPGCNKLPIIELDIDFPIYNMMNGRTESKQNSYIRLNRKSNLKLFIEGQETDRIQRLQHDILYKEATNSRANILKHFKKKKVFLKSEPLILSKTGLVINGNRRLCATRELYYDQGGADTYANFKNLPCAIIKRDLNVKQIVEIEDILQQHEDLKLEYDWYDILLRVKRELDLEDYNYEKVAKNLGWDVLEVRQKEAQLGAMDTHLEVDYKNKLAYAEAFDQQEQIWEDLGKDLIKMGEDEDKKDILIYLNRAIAINPREPGSVKYKQARLITHKKNLLKSAEIYCEKHGKKIKLDEDSDPSDRMQALSNTLATIKVKPNKVVRHIFDTHTEHKKESLVGDRVEQILRKIELINSKSVPDDRKEIVIKLKKISKKANDLAVRWGKKYIN